MFRATAAALLSLVLAGVLASCSNTSESWSEAELASIRSLSLSTLPALAPDPSNRVSDDPAAAALGKALFFDTRLSANGAVACATCHQPDKQFQDGTPLATGIGTTARRTMIIAGTAYSPWFFWDGRKDSQWSQALGPLENPVEHGTDRAAVAHLVAAHYREQYEAVFGPLPDVARVPTHASPLGEGVVLAAWNEMPPEATTAVDTIFANVGKSIAAFERTVMPARARFDRYADALAAGGTGSDIFTPEERLGLKLFIGRANCINCHNGPLLTDNHFHNTGVPAVAGLPEDLGRADGAAKVTADPFNCLGTYSDAKPRDCAELKYMQKDGEELLRAYKPGSLRGIAGRPPYMHAGQFASLAEVVEHYNGAAAAPAGHSELVALNLTGAEKAAIVAFLKTLDAEP
jgi:cytochrome c peroxidase